MTRTHSTGPLPAPGVSASRVDMGGWACGGHRPLQRKSSSPEWPLKSTSLQIRSLVVHTSRTLPPPLKLIPRQASCPVQYTVTGPSDVTSTCWHARSEPEPEPQ